MAEVRVSSQRRLRLEQVSALSVRSDGRGADELVAVGDEEFAVVTAPLRADGLGVDEPHELADVVDDTGEKSDWEAVATDGTGSVFLIEEEGARVVVLAPDLRKQVHELRLRADAGPDPRGRELLEGENSGPEGMLLLAGGHVLVVKQRDPVLLIEFGPRDERPLGFGPGVQIDADVAFRLPAGRKTDLFPLRSWKLLDEETVESANDLAVDHERRLHAISSRSHCIYELEPGPDDGEMVTGERWRLPAAVGADKKHNAEGLAFDRRGNPIVALDVKDTHDNVFVLERLPRAG
jgi:hypothetical protein